MYACIQMYTNKELLKEKEKNVHHEAIVPFLGNQCDRGLKCLFTSMQHGEQT